MDHEPVDESHEPPHEPPHDNQRDVPPADAPPAVPPSPTTATATQQMPTSLKTSTEEALEVVTRLKSTPGERQLYTGGLLGTCVVFLAAMLSMAHLDTALHVALFAIAVAFPLLVLNMMWASAEFEPLPQKYMEALTTGYQLGVWVVGDGLGTVAVVVAFVAIMWHLSSQAVVIGLMTCVAVIVVLVLVALGYVLYRAWREYQPNAELGGSDRAGAAPADPDGSGPGPASP